MGGGRESDYSVCPCPLLQFLQFFSVYVRQVTSGYAGYIRLRQVTSEGRDVELDNIRSKKSCSDLVNIMNYGKYMKL